MNKRIFHRFRRVPALTRTLCILQAALIIMFASGCWNGFIVDFTKRNDLNAQPDSERATGSEHTLVRFAQCSDVHITDNDNPLRYENIKRESSSGSEMNSLLSMASRDQDPYSARIWNAVVESMNVEHATEAFNFAISTGDHTDTGLKRELQWFIDIADGIKSASLQDAITAGTMIDFTPAGFSATLDWYVTVGNHDVEYQGLINHYNATVRYLTPYGDISDLSRIPETVDLYVNSTSAPFWHGFDLQPESSRAYSYGYYSFNPSEYVHCIVLNTAIYNLEGQPAVETLSEGVLDRVQYDWMVSEIEANQDRVCVIFSHHTPIDYFASGISQVPVRKLLKTLCSYENVIAHVNGHTHVNKITAITCDGCPGGYWNINTGSIIEWPQEWRGITVKDNGDGTGTITCRMVRHGDTESLEVAGNDPNADKAEREGTENDRNVELKFKIPLAVKNHILGI